jgi:alpha-tubulin suppressor-like RCC1 family protein
MQPRLVVVASVLGATLACSADPTIPTAVEDLALAPATAASLVYQQMSGGEAHTCALIADSTAWCWGYNASGQLGDGTAAGPESCTGAAGPFACSTRPAAVAGGHRFRQIGAGDYHTCAVSTDFRAWCWGMATAIGDGTEQQREAPTAVAGGHRFRQVDAGLGFTCGVSASDNRAWCWGTNTAGQLGDGSLSRRLSPVPVAGGLTFRQVTAGQTHACGLTTTDRIYCWGSNKYGQLGDSTSQLRRTRPVLVRGGHLFKQLVAGSYHTCAVSTDSRAWCWGRGAEGELGNGQGERSAWPKAVAGGLSVRRITAGVFFTCAETLDSRAWCWGSNSYGQIGNNGARFANFLKPVAVAGGLSVAQMGAGGWHACARTRDGAGYCWGDGFFGALGDGTSGAGVMAFAPTPVGLPLEHALAPLALAVRRTASTRPWEEAARVSGRADMLTER